MLILDKHNWPVERIKGHPIINFFRLIIHGRKVWGNIHDWNKIQELHSKCPNCREELGKHNYSCRCGESEVVSPLGE